MRTLILTLAALLALAPMARADCVADCQASTYCSDDSYDCARLQNECYLRECNNGSYSSDKTPGAYGAIAYGEYSGAYGLSDRSADKDAAKKSAMEFCKQNAKDCRVMVTFSNICAAIAQDGRGSVAGWAEDKEQPVADQKAIDDCNLKDVAHNCHVGVRNCFGE